MRLNFLASIFIVFLSFASLSGNALELSGESKLRKLSFQMRGFAPTPLEYAELQNAKARGLPLKTFFDSKVEEYYQSPWAGIKLSEKLYEDWRLENVSANFYLQSLNINLSFNNTTIANTSSGLSQNGEPNLLHFVQQSILRGESWDQLLTSNTIQKNIDLSAGLKTLTSRFLERINFDKINRFRVYSQKMGRSLETIEGAQNSIAEFEKNPPAEGTVPSNQPMSPYFINSKKDLMLTILALQGAFEGNTKKQTELIAYLGTIKKPILQYVGEIVYPEMYFRTDNPDKWSNFIFGFNDMMNQYKKTIYSKSAAFFRIYLCDEMQPVILSPKNKKSKAALALVQPNQNLPLSMPTPSSVTNTIATHVRADCASCHDKLDPMQKYLDIKATPNQKAPVSRVGAFDFVYVDYTGKKITLTLPSGSDLPQRISQEPQYIRCQSEKFWNWYVGSDVPLTPEKRERLEQVYKQAKSKPVEIIKHLVSQKDYASDEFGSEPVLFGAVRPIFSKCNSCHSGTDEIIPALTRIPFGYDFKLDDKMSEHVSILKKVVDQSNIFEHAGTTKMPPKDAGWSLGAREKNLIARWIQDGAKDDNGKDTLTPDEKMQILGKAKPDYLDKIKKTLTVQPTMRNTWSRILNFSDFVRTLSVKLGSNLCSQELVASKNVLGHFDVSTGLPFSDQPENAFREAYKGCLVKYIQSLKSNLNEFARQGNLNALKVKDFTAFSSQENYALLPLGLYGIFEGMIQPGINLNVYKEFLSSNWQDLAPQLKSKIVRDQLDFVLGPNLNHISHETNLESVLIKNLDKLSKTSDNQTVVTILPYSLYYILNSDSFLTF